MTMKKHFLYLSTAALLAMSFASCVDNDEPKGLEYLRYARANKWDAEAEKTRATIYGDSLLSVYKAVEKDLTNKALELANLKTEALDKLEIEKKTYQLAVDKANMDVELAQAKYDLVRASEDNEKALEQFKADLIAKQIIAKTAQEELDQFNAEAANRLAEINANIKAEEARIKNLAADAQDDLNRNKLYADALAAQLEADTYTANLDNLLIIAAAKKDVWATAQDKVWDAYSNLKTKQSAMLDKQVALFQAQQNLLIAINGYEKDSANNLKTLQDAVTAAQYAYDLGEKAVILAEDALDEFKEVSQGDLETWNKAYNDKDAEISAIKKLVFAKEVEILEATKAKEVAQKNLDLKKDEVEKPLKDFNEKANYYTFVMDDAIVYDADGNEQFTYANGEFKTEKGVIANAKGVKNSDLHTNLDNYLTQIGGSLDRNKIGKTGKYMDETRIKAVESEINGLVKANEGKDKTLAEFVTKYQAQIAVKVSDSITNEQKLKELKVQDEPKTLFDKDSAAFVLAVKEYQDSVAIYKWSDKNGKSTVYERIEGELVAYGKEYSKLYAKIAGEDPAKLLTDTDLNQKRTNIKNKLNEYWNLRKGFDAAYATLTSDFKEKVLGNALTSDDNKNDFDAIVNAVNFNATPVDMSALMKSNNRVSGKYVKDDKEFDAGKWSKYVTAAKDVLGIAVADNEANVKLVLYNASEIAQFKANSWAGVSGSMVDYNKWKEDQDKLQEIINKAHDNQDVVMVLGDGSIDYDAIYADGGTVQLRAAIAYKTEEIAKEKADNDEEIAKKQNDIDNNDLWKDLYEDIADVLDAYDDELKALTIAQQDAYNTELTPLQEALKNAEDKETKLGLEKDELELNQGVKEAIQGKYLGLIQGVTETASATDAELKAEIIIKFAIIDLERNIETAEETLETQKIALANAKKDLEDFKAGEYNGTQNNYVATVTAKDKLVKEAELDYEHAVKEYEVAQTYYDEVLAAVEAE